MVATLVLSYFSRPGLLEILDNMCFVIFIFLIGIFTIPKYIEPRHATMSSSHNCVIKIPQCTYEVKSKMKTSFCMSLAHC